MEMTKYQPSEITVSRHPETVLSEAALVAKTVDKLVKSRPDLVQIIGGRKHPRFELLQIVASMFGVTARVVETRRLESPDGYEAIAEAVNAATGVVLARGEGMCTTDEPTWHMRPKYEWRGGKREKVGEEPVTAHQRRSMAQTRACSKALRLALGWVLGLAGYEATAAEEFDGVDAEPPAPQPPRPRRKSQAHAPEQDQQPQQALISEAQVRRLWAIARECGVPETEVARIIQSRGYESSRAIQTSDYDAIVEEIRAHGKRTGDQELLISQEDIDDELNAF